MWRPRGVQKLPFFSRAELRSGNGIDAAAVLELLAREVDLDLHRFAAKNALSNTPHSAASTPPCTATWFFSTSFFGSVAP